MLDPRAIALQGVGYAALVLALQGFSPVAGPPVEAAPPPAVSAIHGGYDSVHQRTNVFAWRESQRPTEQRGRDLIAIDYADSRDVADILSILSHILDL